MNRQSDAVVLLGGSGHAKVVAEIISDAGQYRLAGYLDRVPPSMPLPGLQYLGHDGELDRLRSDGIRHAFVAIGANNIRGRLGRELLEKGFLLASAISPHATLSKSAKIGIGTAIMAGAVVNAEAVIGNNAIINTGATIDHDCVIGDDAHVAPGCSIAGNVTVGNGAFLGVGARVIPGVTIGDGATVGAGAVVIRDVPAGEVVVGIPARAIHR